ncbi:hypothetical protein Dimus_003199 [Dionaea muscipula]
MTDVTAVGFGDVTANSRGDGTMDANPPVNPETRKHKRRRTGTVQDEKFPKKLKPEKVKEVVVATSSISKSSPQKAVANDVADDVADTSVKAEVVQVADVAAKIVHTPAVADLDVIVDKIVMDVAGMDVPKQDDVVLNELHTPDRYQIPNATDPRFYLSIYSRYVGTLEYADDKFFPTITGVEAQLESMSCGRTDIGIFMRSHSTWSLTFRGSGQTEVLNGGKCAMGVLAVCLVAQSYWVLADINLDKWTIEIYDSLAHKTPKSPGHRLASFAGMRTLLPNILDEAEYFKHSGRERRIEPFKAIQIPPNKVGKQEDGDSCGIWALHFAERLLAGHAINQRIRQSQIPMLRWHFACQIFANSEPIEEDF